jgi:homotetrameric cytidine deaminase
MSEVVGEMLALARQALASAHAPYSGFRVGACLRAGSGRLHAGCNVENAAYPVGQCAEASAIGALVTAGDRDIVEVVVLTEGPELCAPCGRCRQQLAELAGPEARIHLCGPEGVRVTTTLGDLLPLAFGAETLGRPASPARSNPRPEGDRGLLADDGPLESGTTLPGVTPSAGPSRADARPVVVIAYQPRWAEEFTSMARRLRALAGDAALRIDHIGSTAVPGLGAKDVIDLQVTLADLDRAGALTAALRRAGFRHGVRFEYDAVPGGPGADPELRKLFLREPAGERRAHIHVREAGRFNQRYALVFRDYLRASSAARTGYELLKRRASAVFPRSIDGYLFLKEPVLHLLHEAALLWAEKVGWRPDDQHL